MEMSSSEVCQERKLDRTSTAPTCCSNCLHLAEARPFARDVGLEPAANLAVSAGGLEQITATMASVIATIKLLDMTLLD
jgi:hypothetical protein